MQIGTRWPVGGEAPASVPVAMRAAIEVKIRIDIPLPMPFSVTSSANHMMRPVPAVIVMIMSSCAHHTSLVRSCWHSGTPLIPKS